MEEVIKGFIKGQIELYKRQPEGSSAKKGEIYNEIKRLVNDLSYEKIEDYNSFYQTDEYDFILQSQRDCFVDGFMEAINCFINDKWYKWLCGLTFIAFIIAGLKEEGVITVGDLLLITVFSFASWASLIATLIVFLIDKGFMSKPIIKRKR